jgi:hypothetical protein
VATTSITNSPDQFPSHTHLADFEVRVPAVHAGDAHAGHHIGVQLLSTVTTNLAGGYWDFDNVRLSAVQEPMLTGVQTTGGQFQFSLQSDPGLRFEILAATNISLPLTNWVSLGIVTNTTGIAAFSDASAPGDQRFFRARQLP